ncbi:glycosyltransferase family 4 protein [Neolewinella lacunae]|uniref:Glycosyltransferase family 4 protein n=1 Tax=Neolewinella lacunae TaxID=1517758 RepID=A0A923PM10_9BACT|nr:glycosyltransferase family 4 protein [Neolewinella lacunae]MBC6994156.1 glycosyltransferase family 4 protein [Neolewinella lacunae]MDN3636695.1 glycosyltransferase family 4 protein [Neolewinella lacunae]
MRLLFLTDNFPPEVNAPATRTFEHCLEWVRQGVSVTVITCAPNFPQGKVYPGYRNRLWQEEEMEGIRVIRVWSYIAPNAGFYRRVIDFVSFCGCAFVASLFVRTDLIVATSPQFFTAVAGYLASVCKRKPWVMEVRDLWPISIKAVGAVSGKARVLSRLEHLELFLYRSARKVIVVTHSFKKNIAERGIPPEKITVVTNGVHLEQFRARPQDAALVEKLGLSGKFVVGYLGTFGLAHKLVFILRCAPKVAANVHFLLVGDGAKRQQLEGLVAKHQLTNVTILPVVPKAEVARYLSVIDVALVNLRKSRTFRTVIPSKIFENAAMGKPILLGVQGESQAIIERYGAGRCFRPEDEVDFLRQLRKLSEDPVLYARCQANCAALAAAYDRKTLALEMLGALREVVT